MNQDLVLQIERINADMWVAEENHTLGGWVLRSNRDVTWRANSVLPMSSPGIGLDEAIHYCVDFYKSRDITPKFQLTEFSQPLGLDSILEQKGWRKGIEVDVQTKDISKYEPMSLEYQVDILESPSSEWLDCFFEGTGHDSHDLEVRRELMLRSNVHKAFAQIRVGDVVACVGVGMALDGWIGLFRIGTRPHFRRQGLAQRLSEGLLEWGLSKGAFRAFLQVESDNDHAKKLYAKLGFSSLYMYWYRYLPDE